MSYSSFASLSEATFTWPPRTDVEGCYVLHQILWLGCWIRAGKQRTVFWSKDGCDNEMVMVNLATRLFI